MILDLLFPNRCLHCNIIIPGSDLVCEVCIRDINFSHFDYFEENILKEKCRLLFPVENAFALMLFEKASLSRKTIHHLKYGNREKIGKTITEWTIEKLDFKDNKPDLLVTIPLHKNKLKKRGYNQLHLFAEKLSRHFDIAVDHEILIRHQNSKAQAMKNRFQRENSGKKFSLNKEVSGKHILLIDDVFTTGDTLSDAAWEILKGKNNRISILVMAMDI